MRATGENPAHVGAAFENRKDLLRNLLALRRVAGSAGRRRRYRTLVASLYPPRAPRAADQRQGRIYSGTQGARRWRKRALYSAAPALVLCRKIWLSTRRFPKCRGLIFPLSIFARLSRYDRGGNRARGRQRPKLAGTETHSFGRGLMSYTEATLFAGKREGQDLI